MEKKAIQALLFLKKIVIWFIYHKFNLFTVYNLMVLSMFSKLYNHDQ